MHVQQNKEAKSAAKEHILNDWDDFPFLQFKFG